MNTCIIHIQNPVLQKYVQYFIFFQRKDPADFYYKTFPNTNLCLAIYKENHISYSNNSTENICSIRHGNSSFSNRLFGFHEQPFRVNITAPLDQVCILFHPCGLRAFTGISYNELAKENEVFERIFKQSTLSIEQVFATDDLTERAGLLEEMLLRQLTSAETRHPVGFAIQYIEGKKGDTSVKELSRLLNISESTLYRNFNLTLGQNPKDFIQTVRFRNALSLFMKQQYQNLTELTYQSQFYDQSHFIRDFKKRAGMLPNHFYKNIRIEQNTLAWSPGKK